MVPCTVCSQSRNRLDSNLRKTFLITCTPEKNSNEFKKQIFKRSRVGSVFIVKFFFVIGSKSLSCRPKVFSDVKKLWMIKLYIDIPTGDYYLRSQIKWYNVLHLFTLKPLRKMKLLTKKSENFTLSTEKCFLLTLVLPKQESLTVRIFNAWV